MVTQKEIYSLTFLLLHLFDPTCKLLVKATPNIEIIPAEWPYDNVESTEPEIDVPLRFEIRPTPVAFNMPSSAYVSPEIGYQEYGINPTNAIPEMDMLPFRHVIQKRQAEQGAEGSGNGADCPSLADIENGNRQDDSMCAAYNSFNCTVTFTCNSGYTLNGLTSIICQSDDTWSGAVPNCVIVVCPAPNNPTNGNVSLPCRFPTCRSTYTCDSGYELNGQKILTCQENGTWNGDMPTCNIIDCGAPSVSDSTYTGNTQFQGTVTIQCNADYTMTGSATATCQADGTYDSLPTCTYDCGDPPDTQNATIIVNCTVENCFGNVTCAEGYIFFGDNLTCVKDVGWTLGYACLDNTQNPATADISITLNAPPANDRAAFEANVLQALRDYYGVNLLTGNIIDVLLGSIRYFFLGDNSGRRKRQNLREVVEVNYTLIYPSNDNAVGDIVKSQADLMVNNNLTIGGQTQEVLQTTLFGQTFYRNGSLDVEGLKDISCQLFESQIENQKCPDGSECQISFEESAMDTTFCEPIGGDDDFALKVGLGVGIPLFLIACAVIGCCVYYMILARRRRRRRRRKRPVPREYSSSSSATMSGFSPARIPTMINPIGRTGPVYGSYFPEVWDGPESVDSFEETPRLQRRTSLPYVVSVGYEDREPYTSNFSWDFMYPHLRDDFSMPRPKL